MRNSEKKSNEGNNLTFNGASDHETVISIELLEKYTTLIEDLPAETVVQVFSAINDFLMFIDDDKIKDRLFDVYTTYFSSDEFENVGDRSVRSSYTFDWKILRELFTEIGKHKISISKAFLK